jgi:hypothetical protein
MKMSIRSPGDFWKCHRSSATFDSPNLCKIDFSRVIYQYCDDNERYSCYFLMAFGHLCCTLFRREAD